LNQRRRSRCRSSWEPPAVTRDTDSRLLSEASAAQSTPEHQAALDTSRRTAIVDAAERVGPSVVSINATTRRRVAATSPWDFFFVPQNQEQLVAVSGTGFIVRANGIIVTNQHVVADADKVVVTLSDGTDLPAVVLGEDPVTDIAVLKVDRSGLPTAHIGKSSDLMIGEWVVALGNPFAYLLGNTEPTVTAGVVSATGRNILPSQDQAGLYLDMIQTDAAINPAIPADRWPTPWARWWESIRRYSPSPAAPSVSGSPIPDRTRHPGGGRNRPHRVGPPGLDRARGGRRRQHGRLENPGRRPGDERGPGRTVGPGRDPGQRCAAGGEWPETPQLPRLGSGEARPPRGRLASAQLREDGRNIDRLVVSGDLPTVTAEKVNVLRGIELVTVTAGVRSERGLRTENGALIFRISPQIAQATGLQSNDVILAVNRTVIKTAAQVNDLFTNAPPRSPIRVHIERNGQYAFTDLVFR
jgi:serine protease Do